MPSSISSPSAAYMDFIKRIAVIVGHYTLFFRCLRLTVALNVLAPRKIKPITVIGFASIPIHVRFMVYFS